MSGRTEVQLAVRAWALLAIMCALLLADAQDLSEKLVARFKFDSLPQRSDTKYYGINEVDPSDQSNTVRYNTRKQYSPNSDNYALEMSNSTPQHNTVFINATLLN